MRIAAVLLLAVAVSGCVTVAPPGTAPPLTTVAPSPLAEPTATPAPTAQPTAVPTVDATAQPTAPPEPTPPPTPTPATPDPNATPAPTSVDVLAYIAAEITVVNLGDAPLAVTVTLVAEDSSDEYTIGTFSVEPLQVTSQGVVPARFRLEFDYPGGSDADAGTCLIDIAQDEELQFAFLETGGVITAGSEPDDPAEMVVATSSRCIAGGAT